LAAHLILIPKSSAPSILIYDREFEPLIQNKSSEAHEI